MRHNGDRRPDQILAEIDRTRGEMDRTLSAIEQRLTPGQLMDQSLDYLKSSGANEFVHNLGGAAKNNPLPVALVGIGLTWLMALGRQPAQHQGYGAYGSGTSDRMREGMSSMKEQLSERMGSVRESASAGMGSVRERYGNMSESARQQWQRARGGVDSLINEQPLALGAIGLAIGAIMGGLAPRTQKEEEMMGEASRNLMQKTKEAAQPHLEKAKETAKQAAQTATSALQAEQTRREPQSSGKPSAPPSTPTTPRPPRQGL